MTIEHTERVPSQPSDGANRLRVVGEGEIIPASHIQELTMVLRRPIQDALAALTTPHEPGLQDAEIAFANNVLGEAIYPPWYWMQYTEMDLPVLDSPEAVRFGNILGELGRTYNAMGRALPDEGPLDLREALKTGDRVEFTKELSRLLSIDPDAESQPHVTLYGAAAALDAICVLATVNNGAPDDERFGETIQNLLAAHETLTQQKTTPG